MSAEGEIVLCSAALECRSSTLSFSPAGLGNCFSSLSSIGGLSDVTNQIAANLEVTEKKAGSYPRDQQNGRGF